MAAEAAVGAVRWEDSLTGRVGDFGRGFVEVVGEVGPVFLGADLFVLLEGTSASLDNEDLNEPDELPGFAPGILLPGFVFPGAAFAWLNDFGVDALVVDGVDFAALVEPVGAFGPAGSLTDFVIEVLAFEVASSVGVGSASSGFSLDMSVAIGAPVSGASCGASAAAEAVVEAGPGAGVGSDVRASVEIEVGAGVGAGAGVEVEVATGAGAGDPALSVKGRGFNPLVVGSLGLPFAVPAEAADVFAGPDAFAADCGWLEVVGFLGVASFLSSPPGGFAFVSKEDPLRIDPRSATSSARAPPFDTACVLFGSEGSMEAVVSSAMEVGLSGFTSVASTVDPSTFSSNSPVALDGGRSGSAESVLPFNPCPSPEPASGTGLSSCISFPVTLLSVFPASFVLARSPMGSTAMKLALTLEIGLEESLATLPAGDRPREGGDSCLEFSSNRARREATPPLLLGERPDMTATEAHKPHTRVV